MMKTRQSNMELLRIISIILIIMHHFSLYIGLNFDHTITINRLIIQFFTIGGKVGVTCFLLISGYFMVNNNFKVKKLLKLILQLLTYCIFGVLIVNIFYNLNYNILAFLQLTFSSFFYGYWFIIAYLIVYILSPFINKAINCFSKKDLRKLILILIILQCIIPTFLFINFEFSNIVWFTALYIIGAYFRKFPEDLISIKNSIIIFLSSYSISFLIILLFDILDNGINPCYFTNLNTPFTLITSIAFFCLFGNIKVFYNRIINIIASTTLGIYFFHEDKFFRKFLWGWLSNFLNITEDTHSLFFKAIISILFVFICGVIIELIRQNTIERITNKILDKLCTSKTKT